MNNSIQRFYVYDYYNHEIDNVIIGEYTLDIPFQDGENFVGRHGEESFQFNVYDSLESAIRNSGRFASYITYSNEFVDKYKDKIVEIVKKLLSEEAYLAKFTNLKEDWIGVKEKFSESNIMYI